MLGLILGFASLSSLPVVVLGTTNNIEKSNSSGPTSASTPTLSMTNDKVAVVHPPKKRLSISSSCNIGKKARRANRSENEQKLKRQELCLDTRWILLLFQSWLD